MVILSQAVDSAVAFYEKHRKVFLIVSLCALSIASVMLFLWGTATHGIGIHSDSVDYLWSARNLAKGVGLGTIDGFGNFKPMNHFPPLYPILLSAFELAGIGAMEGARWLGAFFIGMLIVLLGLIISRLTGRSLLFSFIGVLVLVFSRAFWNTSLYAMTEPLYLVCSLSGFLCLDYYFSCHKRRWLWIASGLFSLSFLSRYIGISVILTGLLAILFQKGVVRRKIIDIVILGSMGVVPGLAWMIRNTFLTGTPTNRNLGLVPITSQEWQFTGEALKTWIEPVRAILKVNPTSLIVFLSALLISFLLFRKGKGVSEPSPTQLPMILSISAAAYILLTVIARLWADPTIPLYEDRILYPLFISLFFLTLLGLNLLIKMFRSYSRMLATFSASICILIAWCYLRSNASTTFPYIRPVIHSRDDGLGLQFRTSLAEDFEKFVAQLPMDDIFFTDDTQRMYFFTSRSSSYIGELISGDTDLLNGRLSGREIAVVYFHPLADTQAALEQKFPRLKLVYRDDSERSIYIGKTIP